MIKLRKYKIKSIKKLGITNLIDFKCVPYPYYVANGILSHNCHNPELQDFSYGKQLDIEQLIKFLEEREKFFDTISITGGDLLCQDKKESKELCVKLYESFSNKKFWLFTGTDSKDNLPKWVFDIFDVIKIGHYDYKLAQEGFPSSSNQEVIYNK